MSRVGGNVKMTKKQLVTRLQQVVADQQACSERNRRLAKELAQAQLAQDGLMKQINELNERLKRNEGVNG